MLSLFAFLGVFGLSAGLGATAFDYQELNEQANLVVDSQKLQPKLATYDDSNYQITLTADELNNYQWNNFNDYLYNTSAFEYHGNYTLTSDYYVGDVHKTGDLNYARSNGYARFTVSTGSFPGDGIDFAFNQYLTDNHFYNGTSSDYDSDFDYTFSFIVSSEVYAGLKSAIESDIQANTPFDGGAVATDIVTTLVGGITGIATGLGVGVSALVSDIFINNGTLSIFGYIVVIFAGIALAIGLSRWVMNFLTSLGAKK